MVFISCYFCFYYYIIFWNGSFWRAYKRRELSSQETVVFRFRVESGLLFPRFSFRVSFQIEKKKTNLRFPRQQHGKAPPKRYFLRRRDSAGKADPPEQNHLLLQLSSPSVSLCSLHFLLVISLSLSLWKSYCKFDLNFKHFTRIYECWF